MLLVFFVFNIRPARSGCKAPPFFPCARVAGKIQFHAPTLLRAGQNAHIHGLFADVKRARSAHRSGLRNATNERPKQPNERCIPSNASFIRANGRQIPANGQRKTGRWSAHWWKSSVHSWKWAVH